jgi:hypothetical protein
MARQHGITANTCKRFIIDSGAVYTGFTTFASMGTKIGATKGGNSVTIEQEIKEIEVDGARGPVKGCRRITRVSVKATINLIEQTLVNFKRMFPGSTSSVFELDWDAITRSLQIADTDYLSDITIVGEVSDAAQGACAIKLLNVIQDGNIELSLSDKEEGVIAMQFTAHFTTTDLDTEPWVIYWPTEGA